MKSMTFNIPPNPVEAHKVLAGAIWGNVKSHVLAGNRIAVRLCEQSKSRDAESKYHALIGEIAAQIGGDLADRDDAKRILISAFRIDTLNDLAICAWAAGCAGRLFFSACSPSTSAASWRARSSTGSTPSVTSMA